MSIFGTKTYNTPSRRDPQLLALFVRRAEILQRIECEGDVHETRTVVDFVFGARHVDQSDAVVLVVVCDEG